MNIVLVKSLEKKFDKFEKNAKSSVLKILKFLKKDNKFIEVYLIGNREMRRLNREFLGKDKTTNILSFEEPKGFIFPLVCGFTQIDNAPVCRRAGIYADKRKKKLGEIYLNIQQTTNYRLQVTAKGKVLFSIDELLVHGVLHLLGYDHQKKTDATRMGRKEKFLISNF